MRIRLELLHGVSPRISSKTPGMSRLKMTWYQFRKRDLSHLSLGSEIGSWKDTEQCILGVLSKRSSV